MTWRYDKERERVLACIYARQSRDMAEGVSMDLMRESAGGGRGHLKMILEDLERAGFIEPDVERKMCCRVTEEGVVRLLRSAERWPPKSEMSNDAQGDLIQNAR